MERIKVSKPKPNDILFSLSKFFAIYLILIIDISQYFVLNNCSKTADYKATNY